MSYSILRKLFVFFMLSAISIGSISAQDAKVQKGKASYYSKRLHGRKMSNGEVYRNDKLTCAHRKYPFGTLLKVKNPKNGKEVIVEVTDRGPFARSRIIDLSYKAAQELGIIMSGVAMVEVSIYDDDTPPYYTPKMEEIPDFDFDVVDINDTLDIVESQWLQDHKKSEIEE